MTVPGQDSVVGTVLSPQLVTDGATITGNIDTRGFAYLTIDWNGDTEEGSGASATVLSILESDDTVVSNFATITANVAPDYVNPHLRTYAIDMRGRKRYIRISFTAGITSPHFPRASRYTSSRKMSHLSPSIWIWLGTQSPIQL